MCGIAGLVSPEPRPLGQIVRQMSRSLAHRGPDGEGQLLWNAREVHPAEPARVALAHRRLSIIDLSDSAAQPMADVSGRFHLTYNGEIYNYVELREELSAEGLAFRTTSDTEVLLQAMMHWGIDALPRLAGMFAFALFDAERRTVLLARDPFGIKPLFHVRWKHGVGFSSEIPPLLALPGVGRHAARQRVYDYLVTGLTDHEPSTLFRDVHQLPPASWCEIDVETVAPLDARRYWHLDISEPIDVGFDEAANQLRELLYDSVAKHLRSDVPVAAALSGGIDSSTIVLAMRRLGGAAADVQTFSYVADDPDLDEGRWARLAATRACARGHEVKASAEDLVADLDGLITSQAEPFGSTTIYAQNRVFRAMRNAGVKVSLDGQGADELFAGYRLYVSPRVAELVRHGRFIEACHLWRATQRTADASTSRLAALAVYHAAPPWAQRRGVRWLAPAWLDGAWFRDIVRPHWPPPVRSLREALALDLTQLRIPRLLRYADRNSMAHSVESRLPFLFPGLAEFVLRLPEEYLLGRDGEPKAVLRAAVRGLVPDEILNRQDKIGFETPEKAWLIAIRPWVDATLDDADGMLLGALRVPKLRDHWHAVVSGDRAYDRSVWRAINLVRWAQCCGAVFD